MRTKISTFAVIFLCVCASVSAQQSVTPQASGEQTAGKPKPEETELWQPVPEVVTSGVDCNAPPSDAIVLFDGKNLDEWVSSKDKSPANWKIADGVMTVVKSPPGNNIETKRSFK